MSNRQLHLNGRINYPHLFQPREVMGGGKAKYSCLILLEADQAAVMQNLISDMYTADFEGRKVANPLHEGAEKLDPSKGYRADNYFFNAASATKPKVFTQTEEISETHPDASKFYPGANVHILVNLWSMTKQKLRDATWSERVCVELQGIQFVSDNDRFEGGGMSVTGADFGITPVTLDPSSFNRVSAPTAPTPQVVVGVPAMPAMPAMPGK